MHARAYLKELGDFVGDEDPRHDDDRGHHPLAQGRGGLDVAVAVRVCARQVCVCVCVCVCLWWQIVCESDRLRV